MATSANLSVVKSNSEAERRLSSPAQIPIEPSVPPVSEELRLPVQQQAARQATPGIDLQADLSEETVDHIGLGELSPLQVGDEPAAAAPAPSSRC